jgi:hypothetical protein
MKKTRFLFALFLLFSCTAKNNSDKNADFPVFESSEQMVFELDSISQPFTRYAEIIEYKGKTNLAVFNEICQSVDFYSLETKRKEHFISLPKTGVNAFGEVVSVKFINENLIYVLTKKNLFACNDKGEKNKTFSLEKIRDNFTPYSMFQSQAMTVVGSKVYFPVLPEKDLSLPYSYTNTPVMSYVDTQTGETGFLPVNYPHDYLKAKNVLNQDAFVHSAFSPKDSKLYFSFPLSDTLFVYDFANQKSSKFYAGSQSVNILRQTSSGNINTDYALSDEYFSIFVLENGNLMRFFRKGVPEERFKIEAPEEKQNFALIYTNAGVLVSEKRIPKDTGVTNFFTYEGKSYLNKVENEDAWTFLVCN